MKKKLNPRSAFFNPRSLISFSCCAIGVLVSLFAFAGQNPKFVWGAHRDKARKGHTAKAKLHLSNPQVGRPVKSGESIALREMPAAGVIDRETLKALDRREINERNVAFDRVRRRGALPSIDEAIAGKRSH